MPHHTTSGGTAYDRRDVSARLPIWREAFAGLDWLSLHYSPVYAGVGVERGEGQGVMLIPGFMASDASMFELHAWLKRMGYVPYYAEIGRNVGCPDATIKKLRRTLDRAYAETGARVTVIGHSLGGMLARGLAARWPDRVAQVITLGSPVQGMKVHPIVVTAAERLRGSCNGSCMIELQAELPTTVGETSIFSKRDGIVDWRTCTRGGNAGQIEVAGTHIGMIVNPQVYRAIGELLAATGTGAKRGLRGGARRRTGCAVPRDKRRRVPSAA